MAKIFGILAAIATLGVIIVGGYQTWQLTAAEMDRKAAQRVTHLEPPPTVLIRMGDDLDRSYGVLRGSFTLTNRNDFAVADVNVKCAVTAQSGTAIDNYNFTVFRRIEPGKATTVRGYKFGYWPQQGDRVNCWTAGARRT